MCTLVQVPVEAGGVDSSGAEIAETVRDLMWKLGEWVLWESSKCSYQLSHHASPHFCLLIGLFISFTVGISPFLSVLLAD